MDGRFWRSLKAVVPAVALTAVTVVVVFAGTTAAASAIPSIGSIQGQSDPSGGHGIPVLVTGDLDGLDAGPVPRLLGLGVEQ